MRAGRASRTAEQNALFRALESAGRESRRLFDDALARRFLTWPLNVAGCLGLVPGVRQGVSWYIDHRWPGVRSSVVARTRLIDDAITAAVAEATRQLVILGAGFDSRAYRLPSLREIGVFEVDHPSTQAAKRRVLEHVLSALPPHVTFVPCDFNEDSLDAAMARAGHSETARTFILWEGVTNYLTDAAVDATLRWCSRAATGSLLLFTYVHRDLLTRPQAFIGTEQLFASLAKAGERLTWGIEPERLPAFLAERGFCLETDVGAAQYRERYFGLAGRSMRGHEFYRVAIARVREHAALPPASGDA
jgi:methyltransferase (TIGR00027 family)